MTLRDYLDTLKGKRVAVTGIGVSNRPLLKLLLEAGIPVTKRTAPPWASWWMTWRKWAVSSASVPTTWRDWTTT